MHMTFAFMGNNRFKFKYVKQFLVNSVAVHKFINTVSYS
jgi:hypothetical protein